MTKLNTHKINGYIEGYYGRLFTWKDRHKIILKLHQNNLSSYFYCPKEDGHHRIIWKKKYPLEWRKKFQKFCLYGKTLKINILAGISPGLNYNFNNYKEDYKLLLNKINHLIEDGASKIVLMFDDIPNDLELKNNYVKSEGTLHAILANDILKNISVPLYIVPRVYADELIKDTPNYLIDLLKNINKNITLFYCGKKIVSDTNYPIELTSIRKLSKNKIIFWDNIYANDYCPRKLFISPWHKRSNQIETMFNLTGLIETDLFLIDLIGETLKSNSTLESWNKILKTYNIPKEFNDIGKYFKTLNVNPTINFNIKNNSNQNLLSLDFLLWKWKTPLSREWYSFMLILKQDIELFNDKLTNNRILKVYSMPFYNFVRKSLRRNK